MSEPEANEVEFFDLPRPVARAKRPLSGWRRLWIVLSVLIGSPAFLVAWDGYDRTDGDVTANRQVREIRGEQFWNALWKQALREQPGTFSPCVQGSERLTSVSGDEYSLTCNRPVYYTFAIALFWGLVPAAVMWVVANVLRWVYRGFRPRPA